jgi:NTE family protein
VPIVPTGPTSRPSRSRLPRIALVLGSGGVRSAAAIGISEVLNDAGLRPGLVVGCSSGALFGTLVAMELQPHEALQLALGLWSQELTEQRRWHANVERLMPRLAGLNAVVGLHDSRLIADRFGETVGERHIEDLPTALRIVATDAASGRRVVLDRGPLADALRASMAVPFLFPPVQVGGRLLMDGVLSDPLPTAAADSADVVITLGFEWPKPRHIDRPSRLVGQIGTTLRNNLLQARLDAARAVGQTLIAIDVPLDRRIGLWETAAMRHIIHLSRHAALLALPQVMAALQDRGLRPTIEGEGGTAARPKA